jgi:hypothetical protein
MTEEARKALATLAEQLMASGGPAHALRFHAANADGHRMPPEGGEVEMAGVRLVEQAAQTLLALARGGPRPAAPKRVTINAARVKWETEQLETASSLVPSDLERLVRELQSHERWTKDWQMALTALLAWRPVASPATEGEQTQ